MSTPLPLPALERELPAGPTCRLSDDGQWFIETVHGEERRFRIEGKTFEGRTKFQTVVILEAEAFGTMLVIDGETQSAEDDEYVYHEALVHPAMFAHPNPEHVLIIGGGEGATLREVLRHPTVVRATMVDIDGELIALARSHLQSWHAGAFDDPRAEVRIRDGFAFLRETSSRFDIAIVDVCDYVEGTAVAGLYDDAFFRALQGVLKPGAILVVQAGELDRWGQEDHVGLRRLVRRTFPHAVSYSTFVDSFWSEWSFLLAADLPFSIAAAEPALIDRKIATRGLAAQLRFYDGVSHRRMFHLPKDIRNALAGV